ncbi:hypothetical protein AVEN_130901-1 [Araneus ventricosus]|uniref:Uncharacterized protein n=1 Tax=Araneus ventricosus TaxID=182803 RepID=A0A4Y2R9Y8_ARAVE|nr:hypothetical protein AVEN_130901-1 [Araneus ventricosus]
MVANNLVEAAPRELLKYQKNQTPPSNPCRVKRRVPEPRRGCRTIQRHDPLLHLPIQQGEGRRVDPGHAIKGVEIRRGAEMSNKKSEVVSFVKTLKCGGFLRMVSLSVTVDAE